MKHSESLAIIGLGVGVVALVFMLKFGIFNDSLFCFTINQRESCFRYNTLFPALTCLIGIVLGMMIDKINEIRD